MPNHTNPRHFDLMEALHGNETVVGDDLDDRPTEVNDGVALRASLNSGGDSRELALMDLEGEAHLDLDLDLDGRDGDILD